MKFDYSKLLGLMRERGARQEDLAKAIGISTSTLNRKLKGHAYFTQAEIAGAKAFLEIESADPYFFAVELGKSHRG